MSRVARTPILLLCNRFLMHCEGGNLGLGCLYPVVFDLVGAYCFYWVDIDWRNDNACISTWFS